MAPRSKISLIALAGASGLLVILAARFALMSQFDRVSAERYATRLEALHAVDAELSAEILKTRNGLVPNYDALVRTERAVDELYQSLHGFPAFLSDEQQRSLATELDAAEQVSAATFVLVDRFKSENSVLRNSLLFLRTAAGELDAYPGTSPEERAFREGVNGLVRDVFLLRLFRDVNVRERVSRELTLLSEYLEGVPPERRAGLALALDHARAVRDHAPSVDELVREIVAQPLLAHAQALTELYAQYHRGALAAARASSAASIALLLVLCLLAAFAVIVRMRRSTNALRRAGAKLEAALDALREEQAKQRELSELKSRFVSMTSHEFRTPLSAIMSSSEMLCAYDERWSREKKAQHFGRIQNAVLHMTRMLDAILLIGKSDAGKLDFKPGPVRLARLCADSAEIATKALSDAHELSVDVPLDDELVVVADETLLKHVLDNLLSNAIKYSPQGGRIDLAVKCEGEDVIIDVRDRGIGIPPRDRERLFEVFHRGTNVGTLHGSGLGLSIVKRAVDLHGGSVEVESEVGVGTRFVVRMPCSRSDP